MQKLYKITSIKDDLVFSLILLHDEKTHSLSTLVRAKAFEYSYTFYRFDPRDPLASKIKSSFLEIFCIIFRVIVEFFSILKNNGIGQNQYQKFRY
jgi:hypothetical protein